MRYLFSVDIFLTKARAKKNGNEKGIGHPIMRSEWFLHLIFGVQFPFQKKKMLQNVNKKRRSGNIRYYLLTLVNLYF